MIFVVDTNVLFSACLTPAGRIFEILFNTPAHVQLMSSKYAIEELQFHKQKLIRVSRYSEPEMDSVLNAVLKQIDFLDESIISLQYWEEANRLTIGVDSKDISFVALALQTGGWLCTAIKNSVII